MEPAGTTRLNREGDADVNQPLHPGTGSDNGQNCMVRGMDREQPPRSSCAAENGGLLPVRSEEAKSRKRTSVQPVAFGSVVVFGQQRFQLTMSEIETLAEA